MAGSLCRRGITGGLVLNSLGRYEDALAALEEALSQKHDFAEAWHNKGISLINLGHDEEALTSLMLRICAQASCHFGFERAEK